MTTEPKLPPWEMKQALTLTGDYYTVSRIVNRRRVHLEYASNGKPMLYSKERALDAIAKATGGEDMTDTKPPFPDVPSRSSGMDAAEVHAYGLQCFEAGRQQGMAQERALHGLAASSREIEAATAAHGLLVCLRPYVDSLICYASTIDEHQPNGLARDVEAYFATYYGPPKA